MSYLSQQPGDSPILNGIEELRSYVQQAYGAQAAHDITKAIGELSPGQLETLQQYPLRIAKDAKFLALDFPANQIVIRSSVFEVSDQALRTELLSRLFLAHPIDAFRNQQFLISRQGQPQEERKLKNYAVLCGGPALLADIVRVADLKSTEPKLFDQIVEQAETLFGSELSPVKLFEASFKVGNDSFIRRRRLTLAFLQNSEVFGTAALRQSPEIDVTFGIFVTDIQRTFGSLLGKKATIDPLGYLADRIQQEGRASGILPILEEAKVLVRSGTAIDAEREPASLSEWLVFRHNIDELRGLRALGEDEEIEFLEAIDETLRAKASLFAPRRRTFDRLVNLLVNTEINSLVDNLNVFLSETQDLGLLMVPQKGNALKLRTIAQKMHRVEDALRLRHNREHNLDSALKIEGVEDNLSQRAQRHAAIRQIVRSLRLPGFSWVDWVRAMETIGGDEKDVTGKHGTTSPHADRIPPLDPREWTSYLITRVHNPNFKGMDPQEAELLFAFMTGLIPLSAISDGIFEYAPGWRNDDGVRAAQTDGKTVSLSHLIRSALFEHRIDLAETTLVLALESIRDRDIIGEGLFRWSSEELPQFTVFGLGHQESCAWLKKARAQAAESLLALGQQEVIVNKSPRIIEVLRAAQSNLKSFLGSDD